MDRGPNVSATGCHRNKTYNPMITLPDSLLRIRPVTLQILAALFDRCRRILPDSPQRRPRGPNPQR